MDEVSLSALAELLQYLLERPKGAPMRQGTVAVVVGVAASTVGVRLDRDTREWVINRDDAEQTGAGDFLPTEVALLSPSDLPVWGRAQDQYAPILVERIDPGFRLVARHKDDPDCLCGVTVDRTKGVVLSFLSPYGSFKLLDSGPGQMGASSPSGQTH